MHVIYENIRQYTSKGFLVGQQTPAGAQTPGSPHTPRPDQATDTRVRAAARPGSRWWRDTEPPQRNSSGIITVSVVVF